MSKHYYRMLYWRRRLAPRVPRPRRRRGAGVEEGIPRSVLVFCGVVLLVIAASWALASLSGLLGGHGLPL